MNCYPSEKLKLKYKAAQEKNNPFLKTIVERSSPKPKTARSSEPSDTIEFSTENMDTHEDISSSIPRNENHLAERDILKENEELRSKINSLESMVLDLATVVKEIQRQLNPPMNSLNSPSNSTVIRKIIPQTSPEFYVATRDDENDTSSPSIDRVNGDQDKEEEDEQQDDEVIEGTPIVSEEEKHPEDAEEDDHENSDESVPTQEFQSIDNHPIINEAYKQATITNDSPDFVARTFGDGITPYEMDQDNGEPEDESNVLPTLSEEEELRKSKSKSKLEINKQPEASTQNEEEEENDQNGAEPENENPEPKNKREVNQTQTDSPPPMLEQTILSTYFPLNQQHQGLMLGDVPTPTFGEAVDDDFEEVRVSKNINQVVVVDETSEDYLEYLAHADRIIHAMEQNWHEKKQDKLNWHKFWKRYHQNPQTYDSDELELQKLVKRLNLLKDEVIKQNLGTSIDKFQKRCESLRETVESICEYTTRLGLKEAEEPPKLIKSSNVSEDAEDSSMAEEEIEEEQAEETTKAKEKEHDHEEEISKEKESDDESDDSLSGFIVDDEPIDTEDTLTQAPKHIDSLQEKEAVESEGEPVEKEEPEEKALENEDKSANQKKRIDDTVLISSDEESSVSQKFLLDDMDIDVEPNKELEESKYEDNHSEQEVEEQVGEEEETGKKRKMEEITSDNELTQKFQRTEDLKSQTPHLPATPPSTISKDDLEELDPEITEILLLASKGELSQAMRKFLVFLSINPTFYTANDTRLNPIRNLLLISLEELRRGRSGTGEKEPKKSKKSKGKENSLSDEEDEDYEENHVNEMAVSSKSKRRNIKRIKSTSELSVETQQAIRDEEERVKKLNELQRRKFVLDDKRDKEVVLINPEHDESEKDVIIATNVAGVLKPHQLTAVRFCWANIISTPGEQGSGCLLALEMGLGKTLCSITFIEAFLREKKGKSVLCVVPATVVQNWEDEFKKWLKDQCPRLYLLNSKLKKPERLSKILAWKQNGGVLLISYEQFRLYVSDKDTKKVKKGNKLVSGDEGNETNNEAANEEPSSKLTPQEKASAIEALANPGPDLVVVDEAHRIKNPKSASSLAFKMINTKRRLCLTGYPLQNNLTEYWCMVDFIKPKYLGTLEEYRNQFENPIKNGSAADSTEDDVRKAKHRTFLLHNRLKSIVLRYDCTVLRNELPAKHEFIIKCKLSDLQKDLYKRYLTFRSTIASGTTGDEFRGFTLLGYIGNHPGILRNLRSNIGKDIEEDADEAKKLQGNENLTWLGELPSDEELFKLENSSKMVVLMSLLEQCRQVQDKVLVFSRSLATLDFIGDLLRKHDPPLKFYRLDGSTLQHKRQTMINNFNRVTDPTNVFLISTRAGGIGVNLVGANRVVLFDVNWNPCHDVEAAFRVFRFGQKKPTYIYRLQNVGTMEEKVYQRQLVKEGLSKRVVDHQPTKRLFKHGETDQLFELDAPEIVEATLMQPLDDSVLTTVRERCLPYLFSFDLHDRLLRPDETEFINEDEKTKAEAELEQEIAVNELRKKISIKQQLDFTGSKSTQKPPTSNQPQTQSTIPTLFTQSHPAVYSVDTFRRLSAEQLRDHINRLAYTVNAVGNASSNNNNNNNNTNPTNNTTATTTSATQAIDDPARAWTSVQQSQESQQSQQIHAEST